jgi:hypothetical protein
MADDEDDCADGEDADPIDALPSNADWPKRTKDTMADLDPQTWGGPPTSSSAPADNHGEGFASDESEDEAPKIVGDNWVLWVVDGRLGWYHDGWDFTAYNMVNAEFPAERLVAEYDEKHIITWGTRFGPLWEDVLEFLHKRGIKAEGVNLPEMGGERGPYDELNPPPAE